MHIDRKCVSPVDDRVRRRCVHEPRKPVQNLRNEHIVVRAKAVVSRHGANETHEPWAVTPLVRLQFVDCGIRRHEPLQAGRPFDTREDVFEAHVCFALRSGEDELVEIDHRLAQARRCDRLRGPASAAAPEQYGPADQHVAEAARSAASRSIPRYVRDNHRDSRLVPSRPHAGTHPSGIGMRPASPVSRCRFGAASCRMVVAQPGRKQTTPDAKGSRPRKVRALPTV